MGAEVCAADVLLRAAIDRTTTGSLVAQAAARTIRVGSFSLTRAGTIATAQFRTGGDTVPSGAMTAGMASNTATFPRFLVETASGESPDVVLAGTMPSAQGFITFERSVALEIAGE